MQGPGHQDNSFSLRIAILESFPCSTSSSHWIMDADDFQSSRLHCHIQSDIYLLNLANRPRRYSALPLPFGECHCKDQILILSLELEVKNNKSIRGKGMYTDRDNLEEAIFNTQKKKQKARRPARCVNAGWSATKSPLVRVFAIVYESAVEKLELGPSQWLSSGSRLVSQGLAKGGGTMH